MQSKAKQQKHIFNYKPKSKKMEAKNLISKAIAGNANIGLQSKSSSKAAATFIYLGGEEAGYNFYSGIIIGKSKKQNAISLNFISQLIANISAKNLQINWEPQLHNICYCHILINAAGILQAAKYFIISQEPA